MATSEIITLLIAIAALATSAVSAYEMMRQGRNAVRPVLVVLEKHADNAQPGTGLSLYLVNMGQAIAIDVEIARNEPAAIASGRAAAPLRREVAANRRMLLVERYSVSCLDELRLEATYRDVNGARYRTTFAAKRHAFHN